MDEFLIHLFALSLGGGVIGLGLMGLARATRSRYAARWRCVVWLLLCARLAIPLSLMPRDIAPVQIQTPSLDRPVVATAAPSNAPSAEHAQISNPEMQPQEISWQAPSFVPVICVVWAIGTVGVLLWSVASHLRLRRYLRRWSKLVTEPSICERYQTQAHRLKITRIPPLVYCPGLKIPMLAGVLRPVLMLPEHMEADDMLDCALLHELIHYRRKDIWLKVVAVLATSVHWFNPLVWLMERQVEQDMELACDETALAVLPPEEHRAYGETILRAAAQAKEP